MNNVCIWNNMNFYHSQENIKTIIGYRGSSLKVASRKVVYKERGFLRNKTAAAVTKSNDDTFVKPDENSRSVEEIINTLEKRDDILNK